MIWRILSLSKITFSGNRASGVAGQIFTEEIKQAYESSIQSAILAEGRNRGGVIQKGSVGNSHISSFESLDIHKRLTRFSRIVYKQKLSAWCESDRHTTK